jgi:hypothetical protein
MGYWPYRVRNHAGGGFSGGSQSPFVKTVPCPDHAGEATPGYASLIRPRPDGLGFYYWTLHEVDRTFGSRGDRTE